MVETIFIEAKFNGEVELNETILDHLKEKKVALYMSIQFIDYLEKVKEQLEVKGIKVFTSKPKRCGVEGQLLGCDCYPDSLNLEEEEEEIDCYLYIGDGRFHPLALVYGQKDNENPKEVICFNPIENKIIILGKEDIISILKRYKGSLTKFLTSTTIGVISTIKPGQEQFKLGIELREKFPDKDFYYFIDNNISFDQLENFPFIDVWVNTACPRIGFDEQEMFRKGVVNVRDLIENNREE